MTDRDPRPPSVGDEPASARPSDEAAATPSVVQRALVDAVATIADALDVARVDRRRLASSLPLFDPRALPVGGGGGGDAVEEGADAVAGEGSPVVDDPSDPGAIGRLHQVLLDPDHRHRRGVHYTPGPVAALLVARTLDRAGLAGSPPIVCDPSCGGGAFLLAAADHLSAGGLAPASAVAALRGIDIDPLAVEVTRTALVLWAARAGLRSDDLLAVARGTLDQVVEGDALHMPWPDEGHLDAVVGNPPFGGQLGRSTARGSEAASAARALLGGSAAGYADSAGLFLVRAASATAAGGRVAMVQPLSFLGSRDAGAVRRRLEELAVLEEVWLADERLFGAAVDVCAPVLRVAGPLAAPEPLGPVRVTTGAGPTRDDGTRTGSGTGRGGGTGDGDGTSGSGGAGERRVEQVVEVDRDRLARSGSWAPVMAAATGVPTVALHDRPVLGGLARATAGFRDEFYALAPFVRDLADPEVPVDPEAPRPELPGGCARLVTSGLIEPARTLWARRTTRLAGTRLRAPVVDVHALRAWSDGPDGDRRLAAWADARLRPKVVVATQTRVVEAAVDDDGSWWPSVPVISIVLDAAHDDDEQRWLVAAALSAPPVSAWAAERSAGTAMAAHALKLSARQVGEVPLPLDLDAWKEGARLLRLVDAASGDGERAARLAAAGSMLTDAHELLPAVASEVLRWWRVRAGCGDVI